MIVLNGLSSSPHATFKQCDAHTFTLCRKKAPVSKGSLCLSVSPVTSTSTLLTRIHLWWELVCSHARAAFRRGGGNFPRATFAPPPRIWQIYRHFVLEIVTVSWKKWSKAFKYLDPPPQYFVLPICLLTKILNVPMYMYTCRYLTLNVM